VPPEVVTNGTSTAKAEARPRLRPKLSRSLVGSDLEAMKQEILREMRKEITKAKKEIIDGEISNPLSIVSLDLLTFFFLVIRLELSRFDK
jgi:hypothetical protein